MSNNFGYTGIQTPGDGAGDFSAQSFLVRQLLSKINTATLVQIVAVTNSGGLSQVGFVDVQPMVNQVDGAKNAVPHGVLHHLPYFRLQGGTDAIILDPKVGDIGIAVFADHDISSVAASKAQANPGSWRRFAMADGIYIGGVLNGTPAQYVQFTAGGINIVSPTKITLSAPLIEIDAATSVTVNAPQSTINSTTLINGALNQGTGAAGGGATMAGPVTVTNDVTAGGKSLKTHVHSDPQGGTTGAPV